MQYREFGNTGLKVSVIGLGCGLLGDATKTKQPFEIVRKSLDYGVNYFDTAYAYADSEVKIGQGLGDDRKKVYISSKTMAKTKEEAWKNIRESLQRLKTEYIDNYHLHGLENEKDVDVRLGSGGALEALKEARDQGLIRHIGCTSHQSRLLIMALNRFDFETILVPMNPVEPEPLEKLIPLCNDKGVGVSIMKPVAWGALPAKLALKWILNKPIDTAVPGATTLEQLKEDCLVGNLKNFSLTKKERNEENKLKNKVKPESFWWHSARQ